MKYILFILILLRLAESITLTFPFNECDSSKFLVTKYETNSQLHISQNGINYRHTFYETQSGEPITEIIFKGYTLYTDTKERKVPFRRLVNYCEMGNRSVITIYTVVKKPELEGVFYIANMKVYDLMNASKLYTQDKEAVHNKAEANSLKSMYFVMDPRVVNQSETLEEYEAETLKTDDNVTEEEIDEDVRRIFRTIIIKKIGSRKASSSGARSKSTK